MSHDVSITRGINQLRLSDDGEQRLPTSAADHWQHQSRSLGDHWQHQSKLTTNTNIWCCWWQLLTENSLMQICRWFINQTCPSMSTASLSTYGTFSESRNIKYSTCSKINHVCNVMQNHHLHILVLTLMETGHEDADCVTINDSGSWSWMSLNNFSQKKTLTI